MLESLVLCLGLLLSTLQLAVRRLMANRRLAAGLLAGFVVAVAGASSVPAFTAGALQRLLQSDLAAVTNRRLPAGFQIAHFDNPERPSNSAAFYAADRIAQEEGPALLGLPLETTVTYGALLPAQAIPTDRNRPSAAMDRWVSIAFLTGLQEHATLAEGRWPEPHSAGQVYEAVVEEVALDKLELTLGSELTVPVSKAASSKRIQVRVVGVFKRTDPRNPYWFLGNAFERELFVSRESFLDQILAEPKAVPGQYAWYYGIQSEAVRMTGVVDLLEGAFELEARMAQALPDTAILDGPHELLLRYLVRANRLQLQLLLLSVPVLVVVGYFLVVTSGMMVAGQRQEIAVLRSRGARLVQVVGVQLAEGLVLGTLALVMGYPLGILLARMMSSVSGFLRYVVREQTTLLLPADFWLYGVAAAALAVMAYVLPVIPTARLSIVAYKQDSGRASRRPAWLKWGLDLVLFGLAGYSYYTLAFRRSGKIASDADMGGNAMVQPLDILAPALFILAGGLFALRLFPSIARLLERGLRNYASPAVYLAVTQLSRAVSNYSPVVLLLTLTVGMGLYNAVTARTLEQNVADRVGYAYGADIVVEEAWEYVQEQMGGSGVPIATRTKEVHPPPWEVHYALPGVVHSARVRRDTVTPVVGGRSQPKANLMAIDPPDFGRVAWFRRDLAAFHFNEYLNLLAQDEEAVLVTPSFLEKNRLQPGDRISLAVENGAEVSLVIYAAVPYWPALSPYDGDFFVANLDYIERNLGLKPYEVWFKPDEGLSLTQLITSLKDQGISVVRAQDARQELIRQRRDPQQNGLLGALTNGFLLSLTVTVLGFWLYAALNLRTRVLQFGVMRAMGLSVSGLLRAVIFEQTLTVVLGVVTGTGVGMAAASLFAPFLHAHGAETLQPPPFLIVVDPSDRNRLYVVMLVMLLVGLGGLVAALQRLRVYEAVKLGEDH